MKHHYPGCELGDRCNCDAIDEALEQTTDEPMTTPTKPYRNLVEGERIEVGDECLHASGSWLPTSSHGDFLRLEPDHRSGRAIHHRPHRRPLTSSNRKPTMTTPTTPTHSYRILRDNKTKPVRFIVLIDGKIYVEGVTRTVAHEIVAGHMLMTDPDLGSHQAIIREFILSSGI